MPDFSLWRRGAPFGPGQVAKAEFCFKSVMLEAGLVSVALCCLGIPKRFLHFGPLQCDLRRHRIHNVYL